MAAAARGNKGLVALFKRGWDEIPEVVGSSFVALAGIGLASVGLYNYYAKDGDNRKYKAKIIVMRPDDPRVEKVHKD